MRRNSCHRQCTSLASSYPEQRRASLGGLRRRCGTSSLHRRSARSRVASPARAVLLKMSGRRVFHPSTHHGLDEYGRKRFRVLINQVESALAVIVLGKDGGIGGVQWSATVRKAQHAAVIRAVEREDGAPSG